MTGKAEKIAGDLRGRIAGMKPGDKLPSDENGPYQLVQTGFRTVLPPYSKTPIEVRKILQDITIAFFSRFFNFIFRYRFEKSVKNGSGAGIGGNFSDGSFRFVSRHRLQAMVLLMVPVSPETGSDDGTQKPKRNHASS